MNEDEILSWLRERARERARERGRQALVPLGDDAAVLEWDGARLVVTTDALAENVHFDRRLWSWEQVGEKLLASALSDVQAMGGEPRAYLVSMALPAGTEMDVVEALARGWERVEAAFDLIMLGGDTLRSERSVMLDAVVLGRLEGEAIRRSGASAGETLFLTGGLGLSAWALERRETLISMAEVSGAPWRSLEGSWDEGERERALERDREAWNALLDRLGLPPGAGPDLCRALQGLLVPRPPRLEPSFFRAWRPTSAIDVSDGLARDLRRLSGASGVGFRVREAPLLEASPTLERLCGHLGEEARDYLFGSGEEYQLLFTSSHRGSKPSSGAVAIGSVTEGGLVVETTDGGEIPLPDVGHVHRF